MGAILGALIGQHGIFEKHREKIVNEQNEMYRANRDWDEIQQNPLNYKDDYVDTVLSAVTRHMNPETRKIYEGQRESWRQQKQATQSLQTMNAPSQRPQMAAPPLAPPPQMTPPPSANGSFPGMGAAMQQAAPAVGLAPPPAAKDPVTAMADQRGEGFGPPPAAPPGQFPSAGPFDFERMFAGARTMADIEAQKAGGIAAAQMPSKIAESQALEEAKTKLEQAKIRGQEEQFRRKLQDASEQMQRLMGANPAARYTLDYSPNGMPYMRQDKGTNVPGYQDGTEIDEDAVLPNGKEPDRSKGVYYRTTRYANGSDIVRPSNTVKEVKTTTRPDGTVVQYAVDKGGNIVAGTERTVGVNPAMMGTQTSSTRVEPGGLTTTTAATRQKVAPGTTRGLPPPPGAAPAGVGGGAAPVSQQARTARTMADAWLNGGPAPSARWMPLVQQDLASRGVQSPIALTGAGGKDVQAVDSVLGQINDAMKQLENEGLSKSEDRDVLGNEYLKYRRFGSAVPHQDLFTNLNFERYRSGGAALQGIGSRARQILQDALIHTPNLEPAAGNFAGGQYRSDTPATIYGKLQTIKRVLEQKRQSVIEDERKSGVIGSLTPPPSVGKSSSSVEKWGRDSSGRLVRQ